MINDGTYKFIDPTKNSAALNYYLYPEVLNNLNSDEVEIQATFSVPGVQAARRRSDVAGGGSVYYEAVDGPARIRTSTARLIATSP